MTATAGSLVAWCGDGVGVGGEVDDGAARIAVGEGGGGDHRGGGRVGAHELEPLGGEAGIEGEVGGAALEGGEHGDDHVEAAFEMDADDVASSDAAGDEVMGELVGALVELPVGERLVGEDDCGGGRGAVAPGGRRGSAGRRRGRRRRGCRPRRWSSSARSVSVSIGNAPIVCCGSANADSSNTTK